MDARELLKEGVSAVRAGDKERARKLFAKVVQVDPNLVQGWWGLANVLDDDTQRRFCLRKVLALDPGHTQARKLLAKPSPEMAATPKRPPTHPRISTIPKKPPSVPPRQPVQTRSGGISSGLIIGLAVVGLMVCGGSLGALILSGALDGLTQGLFPSPQASAPPTDLPRGTMPPAWTPTPSFTPKPTQVAETVDVQPIATEALTEQQLDILEHIYDEEYEEAMLLLDELIDAEPENHWTYYHRAVCSLNLTRGNTSLPGYIQLSMDAIADSNRALGLGGELIGDYYNTRSWGFENLGRVAEYRVDQERLIEVALENNRLVVALPHTDPYRERGIPMLLVSLGRCEEALIEVDRIIQARGEDAAPSSNLHYTRGMANMCLGNYGQGIVDLNVAVSLFPQCSTHYMVALALYYRGDSDAALDKLNFIIEECPSYAGYRYYLRALIYHEQGQNDLARQDLFMGSLNTWSQATLKAYVEGLIALEEGQRERGIELLKLAEMTMDNTLQPFIERTRNELAALGEEPYAPVADPIPEATPIPPLPVDHPIPPPIRHLKFTESSGVIELEPGEALELHFVAPSWYEYDSRAQSLRVHILAEGFFGTSDLRLHIYDSEDRRRETIELMWGENRISSPHLYVSPASDIYMELQNTGEKHLTIQDVGIEVVVKGSGIDPVRYSFLEE